MGCSEIVQELIDASDDISEIDRITSTAAYRRAMSDSIARARRTGKYTLPSKKVSQFINKAKKLVGQSLMFESTNDYKAHFVQVEKTEMIAPGVVANYVEIHVKQHQYMGTKKKKSHRKMGSSNSGNCIMTI